MEALHIHYSVQETECCKVSRDPWVIAQRELTSEYRGCDRKPTEPSPPPPLSPSLHVPSVHLHGADRHHADNPRSYHSCGVVRPAADGLYTVSLRTAWQTVCALLCRCSVWPGTAKSAGAKAFPALQPSWDACGGEFTRKAGGRNAAGGGGGGGGVQGLADLQITHGKKQIGLICAHAHTCARRRGHRWPGCCCRLVSAGTPATATDIRGNSSNALKPSSFPTSRPCKSQVLLFGVFKVKVKPPPPRWGQTFKTEWR